RGGGELVWITLDILVIKGEHRNITTYRGFAKMSNPSTNPFPAPSPYDLACLGPPALLEGEDAAGYDELLGRISGTLKPADPLEQIWVRDVVDLVWEIFRLRRLKAALMREAAYEGVDKVLMPRASLLVDSALYTT